MRRFRGWIVRLGGLFNKQRKDRELEEEIESHLQFHIEDNLRLGMTQEEARRRAIVQLGGIESTKETCRDQRGIPSLETLWQDIRYGARALRKNPLFTTVAVLTLAVGIGVNTTIFNLINAIFLRSLPGVSRIKELASFDYLDGDSSRPLAMSYADYLDFRNLTNVLEGTVASGVQSAEIDSGTGPETGQVGLVSGNYFSVLGVRTPIGRFFAGEEGLNRGVDAIAVLSHEYWKRRFEASPAVVGKVVRINQRSFTIIGIAESGFRGDTLDRSPNLWVPLSMVDEVQPFYARLGHDLLARGQDWLRLRARLRPNVSIQTAAIATQLRSHEIEQNHRDVNQGRPVTLVPLEQSVRGDIEAMATQGVYFQAICALFLLVGCANLANLMLARAFRRRREIGVRLALGASGRRLLRQFLTECLLLSSLGGMAGLLLSYWITCLLVVAVKRFNGISFYQFDFNLTYDCRVVGFLLALTIFIGVVFGLLSAWMTTDFDHGQAFKSNPGNSGKLGRFSVARILVTGQVAVSLVLLALASLCARSLYNALAINLGFNPKPLLSVFLDTPSLGESVEHEQLLLSQILKRVQNLPGVKRAALAQHRPLGFTGRKIYGDLGRAAGGSSDADGLTYRFSAYANSVSSDYFQTLGIPIVLGRAFDRELANGGRVVIINETLARHKWPGENPIGKRLCVTHYQKGTPLPGGVRPPAIWAEIVGVAKDSKYHGLVEDPPDYLYWSLDQVYEGGMHLIVHADKSPASCLPEVRQVLQELAPGLKGSDLRTMEAHLDYRYFFPRRAATLIAGMSLVGLLIAALGLYGVLSCTVAQRMKEFAIRIALGANQRTVLRHVLVEGLRLTGCGVLVGAIATAGSVRLIHSYLYGISGIDAPDFLAVVVVLATASLAASLIPAYRATKADPIAALKHE